MPTIVDVYRQYGVAHEPGTADWINSRCPHCGGSKLKLGFNTSSPRFWCFQCGWHRGEDTLVRLLGVDEDQAREIWRSLGHAPGRGLMRDRKIQSSVKVHGYRRPQGTMDHLTDAHARYLEGRGFDPSRIQAEWGVCSTGPTSRLDGIDYRNRLLIPISWGGQEVSFQTRDTTGRSDRKYMACPEGREAAHHKHILYGQEGAWRQRLGIAVEGVTDVWRLGPLAFCVFGVQYRPEQVLEIARRFDRVAVVFDGEYQAQHQARRLAAQLSGMGVRSVVIDPGDADPGSMTDTDAAGLVSEVRRWGSQI